MMKILISTLFLFIASDGIAETRPDIIECNITSFVTVPKQAFPPKKEVTRSLASEDITFFPAKKQIIFAGLNTGKPSGRGMNISQKDRLVKMWDQKGNLWMRKLPITSAGLEFINIVQKEEKIIVFFYRNYLAADYIYSGTCE